MSKLLINETPLMMCPSLGAKIGVDEALILQQIHYLINPDINQNIMDGKHWVYNTYAEWYQKFKGCWSESTIKNIFLKLEKLKLLIVRRFDRNKYDRTKWYTIDYEVLNKLDLGTTDKNCPKHETKIVHSNNGQKLSDASDKNCPINKDQETCLQENKENARARARDDEVKKVFEHWQNVMGHQKAKLDPQRRLIIKTALNVGYSLDDLCKAITGCSLSPYHMGKNDHGQRYDRLGLILKAEKIDHFLGIAEKAEEAEKKRLKDISNAHVPFVLRAEEYTEEEMEQRKKQREELKKIYPNFFRKEVAI